MKETYQWKIKNDFPFAQKHKPAKGTVGQEHITFSVSSFTQFDPVKCIIVGYVDDTARINQDFVYPDDVGGCGKLGPLPKQYIEVAQKNQNTLAEELQKIGIEVVRVGEFDFSQKFVVCGVETTGFSCFSPRDFPFIYHDSFYQFPMTFVSNVNMSRSFEWIQKQLHANKSKIYSTWGPKSQGFRFQNSPQPLQKKIFHRQDQYFADAANLLKVGLDIFFSFSICGSRGCILKFRQLMDKRYKGVVRVHALDYPENYDNFHIDTTFSFIGWNKKIEKFIVVVNGKRTNPTTIPAILRGKNWALIELSKFNEQFQDPDYQYVSEAIGMNFLTLNPELLVTSDKQVKLKQIMEFYGVKCLQLENKHAVQLAGGFHCITNEINREDTYNFGQILQKDPKELTLKERAGLFDENLLQFLQSKGPIDEWVKILNENNIFPEYLHDHLSAEERLQMQQRHADIIKDYRSKNSKSQTI